MITGITLSLPSVQTYLGKKATDMINKDFKTDINIEQVSYSIFGGMKLKKVMIRDHHKDTLIYVGRIQTDILSYNKLFDGDLTFTDIRLDSLHLNIKTYKKESDNSLNVFITKLDSGPPSKNKFLMTAKNAYLTDSRLVVLDENSETPLKVNFKKLNGAINNFKIYGPDVTTKINKLSFKDHRGLIVENLTSQFSYTKKAISLKELELKTKYSELKGQVVLNYKIEDFSDFLNKVKFDIIVNEGIIGTNDIYNFFADIGRNKKLNFKSHIVGTLNNLTFFDLKASEENKTTIDGKIQVINSFGDDNQKFNFKGEFKKLTSNYDNLVSFVPKILKDKVPDMLRRVGNIQTKGTVDYTVKSIDANLKVMTDIGNISSKFLMTNLDHIEQAKYKGNIILEQFNLGVLLADKKLGKSTLNLDIEGSGFDKKNLNTTAKGKVTNFVYNNYNYKNITLDGNFKSPVFEGKLVANDPNLKLNFDGILNIGAKENKINFESNVEYANLRNLHFSKDSISIFKGNIKIDLVGSTIDDVQGVVNFNETSFQNNKNTYYFEDFLMTSSFDADRVRTIEINSPDIIQGSLVGKFRFGELLKMVENGAGSLYHNYKPNIIKKGQFIRYDFKVYNKIVEIFYPEIEVGTNTSISGSIKGDDNDFKLNFVSPNIKAFQNEFDKINIKIDNKNPLYNAYIEMDSIKTKSYKVSSFNLINVTSKDTLFVRTEFKGGNKAEDDFKLNFYHTIDDKKNNIVGLKKSEITYRNFLWFLNEEDQKDNKIVFDKDFKNFDFDKILLTHDKQRVAFNGFIKGKDQKDLSLELLNVDLNKVIPPIDSLRVDGLINGKIFYKQNGQKHEPTADLNIKKLKVNNKTLGDFKANIIGDDKFKKFNVDAHLENDLTDSFTTTGTFEILDNKTTNLDLEVRFNGFDISPFSPMGKNVMTNIRGNINGATTITGNIEKPIINGRLYVDKVGMTIPYLNVDYALRDASIIDLTDDKFIFQNNDLYSTEKNLIFNEKKEKIITEGKLNGFISHKNFTNWNLGLYINSKNLLILNTDYTEDALYYGKAFIEGSAKIEGLLDEIAVTVEAKSNKGTAIKLPMSDGSNDDGKSYLHFLSPKEKENLRKGIVIKENVYKGLELKFDLNITKDAEIEVILNRDTGHNMIAWGQGSLLMEINTLGKFKMTGDYIVDKGTYNFKYSIISKEFNVKQNSSIVWEGDPMKARLNLEAIYKLPSGSNPAILLENSSSNSNKVETSVNIGITGTITTPEPDFRINFPTLSSTVRSELDAKLSDPSIRQTQALALLGTGSFISTEGISQNAVYNNLAEKAGDILNGLFKNDNDKFIMTLLLSTPERTASNVTNNGVVGFAFNAKLNERIRINGKLGVPYGGITQNTVIGNIEILYRVNEDGTFNLRFFNRENEISYIGQGIGYTQGVGFTYQVDFDTFSELVNKLFKKKVTMKGNSIETVPDSDQPDQHNDQKKNKEPTNQLPIEGVPPKDDF